MNTKFYASLIAIALVVIFFGIGNAVQADEIVTLNWFSMEEQILPSGKGTVNFDFYGYEDHSAYIGTLAVGFDGNTFYVDEIVDVPQDGFNSLTQAEIVAGMESFAQSVFYVWDIDPEQRPLAFANGMPQEFQIDRTWEQMEQMGEYLRENQPQHTVFLPVILN